ncbi:hypothetical protein Tco_1353844 [Tanacetum coccineum]
MEKLSSLLARLDIESSSVYNLLVDLHLYQDVLQNQRCDSDSLVACMLLDIQLLLLDWQDLIRDEFS